MSRLVTATKDSLAAVCGVAAIMLAMGPRILSAASASHLSGGEAIYCENQQTQCLTDQTNSCKENFENCDMNGPNRNGLKCLQDQRAPLNPCAQTVCGGPRTPMKCQ
jgi:hypothetical protein